MKADAPTLSEHLLAEARLFVVYPNRVRRAKRAADFVEKTLGPRIVEVGFAAKRKGPSIETVPSETHAKLLNEFFAKKLVSEVPAYVSRRRLIQPVEATIAVPRQVSVYLEQATWSFVYGLWDASVALARACLEAAIEDRVGRLIGKQQRDLSVWIAEAHRARSLNAEQIQRAKQIKDMGNIVLHERNATAEEAERVALSLRTFLAAEYR